MTSNRKGPRAALAAALIPALPRAQTVVTGMPELFDTCPVVVVVSGGTGRNEKQGATFGGGSFGTFYYDVYAYVLPEDEDACDDLEQQIAAFVDTHRQTADWEDLDYAERSRTTFVKTIDGKQYKQEKIPLKLSAFA